MASEGRKERTRVNYTFDLSGQVVVQHNRETKIDLGCDVPSPTLQP